jgi:CheY-like chemotaxis protein
VLKIFGNDFLTAMNCCVNLRNPLRFVPSEFLLILACFGASDFRVKIVKIMEISTIIHQDCADLPLVVWLVDDDPVASVLFRMESQRTGMGLQTADFMEPRTALASLRAMCEAKRYNALPCCIFLDLHMPGMTGWEFIEGMRTLDLPRGVFVFVVSSTDDEADFARAKSTPEVVSLMPKPLTAEKIKSSLSAIDLARCDQTF